MVSYKFTLKAMPNAHGEYLINLALIKYKINTSLSIKEKCKHEDWSFKTERLEKSHKEYKQIDDLIEKYSGSVNNIIHEFELDETPFTLKDIITKFKKGFGKTACIKLHCLSRKLNV